MKILNIVGARPNFMKVAPLHRAFQNHPNIESKIVHTGQHFDAKMSDVFFEQLELPKPDYFLGIGGGSHTQQTARIMLAFEEVMNVEKPDLVLVVGDVTSTIACALVAVKMEVKVAHVEAGLRSGDRKMPEEINRILTDSISDMLFVTEQAGMVNLAREGVVAEKVFFVGNCMIDSLAFYQKKAQALNIIEPFGLTKSEYVLVTMHRPANVDTEGSNKKRYCATVLGWTSGGSDSGDIEWESIDFGIFILRKAYFCPMKNLPIGLQTLESIRELNCVYVDKTQMIHRLVTKGKYYFLSRPRRFGKSLLISTMKALFLGKKELFEETWIENNWDWSKTNPVIHFSFDKMGYQSLGLDGAIIQEIKKIAKEFKVRLSHNDVKSLFNELLEKVSKKHGQIVLLIDEYDKPIIDFLEFPPYEQAKVNQNIMRQFYSVLKSAEPYLRFFFVTGVSKFSKVSMFSELNNLKDITLHPDYATIAGYTQTELEYYFEEHLQVVENHLKTTREELVKQMRYWYNGFSWDGINKVYNPFGTLNFFDQKRFRNYWFSTGNPKFLIQQMKKQVRFDIENSKSNGYLLDKYDIDNLDLVPLCFQTGYLTVKHIDEWTEEMVLDYPNKEVRESMYQFMIDDIAKNPQRVHTGLTIRDLNQALLTNDLPKVKTIINSLLASLPYETYKNQSEGFYHGLLHLIFSYIGMFIESEPHLSQGRADVVVQTPQYIYIFEFKFNHTAAEALDQIKNNQYADKYRATEKPIFGIGVNFNETKKQIDGWLVEILS